MPANLTPQYHDAEETFKRATSDAERIAALEEMLRVIPKHKGTEKMQADLKRRRARLRRQAQSRSGPAASKPDWHHIPREGAGQIVLCGPPNSGKSRLLDILTHARPDVADYPFTTRTPQPGMMSYQDIQIQLVDTVPLAPEVVEPWHLALIENADGVLLLFDVTDPALLEQTDYVLRILDERGLQLGSDAQPPTRVLGNKTDLPGARDEFQVWSELYRSRFVARPFSALSEADLLDLKPRLFELIQVVRAYTKAPGKKPDPEAAPFVLSQGSSVHDLAAAVHKDLAESFKFARVWNRHGLDGQMVERTYSIRDGDLVEIHN